MNPYPYLLCRHFIATDAKKFHDVWVMSEEEANK